MKIRYFKNLVILFIILVNSRTELDASENYRWISAYDTSQTVVARILPPVGYHRIEQVPGSFSEWLRNLPLKPPGTPVRLYNNSLKSRQDVHHSVIDIDVGKRDLQQCADAIIRLRAEYLFSKSNYDEISFKFTSGDDCSFRNWIIGIRPNVNGNIVDWQNSSEADSTWDTFRNYLDTVFTWAGSASLSKETIPKQDITEIKAGDIFIQGGNPGHGIIVLDLAQNPQTGKTVFLLAQSYMPAQDIHILNNFTNPSINPWYEDDFTDNLDTPQWTFYKGDLKSFQGFEKADEGLDIGKYLAQGNENEIITILRIDPNFWDLKLLGSSEISGHQNLTAEEWCSKYNFIAAINAGMFHTDYSTHVGYMKNGAHVNNAAFNQDRSFAAFSPVDEGFPLFRIFDLDETGSEEITENYNCAVQNLRLIKRPCENRWSREQKKWSEAALGEDNKGRALFIFCRAPFTMPKFNDILISQPIGLQCAQHLEGGPEAQLYIDYKNTKLDLFGSYESVFFENDDNMRAWEIPNIIGVSKK